MGDELRKIHKASVRILSEIGIRLHHPEILELLQTKGIRVEGKTAYFEDKQLKHWVNMAPGRFSLTARNPEYEMFIGGDKLEYAAGYGAACIVDAQGNRRSARIEDYLKFLQLVHQSRYFNLNGGLLVQPMDLMGIPGIPLMLYATILYSDKCLMGMQSNARTMEQIMDMVAIIFGGKDKLLEQPRILTMISTLSPLQIDRDALDSMLICSRYRQPMIFSPGPSAGTTGPITIAGNISLANAEALAGIAISQMIRPGTPVIYGLQSTVADMQSGSVSTASPAYSIQSTYCARLARMYGIPSRTGGTNNDAKGVSVQSGYESMFTMLNACLNGVNLVVHSAGMLDSYAATSYEQFIVDLEIISMIEFYLQGIEIDEDSFAFEVIKEVGSGGQFLTTEHTLQRCRTESWSPMIGLRGALAGISPNDQFLYNIEKSMDKMLKSYVRPTLDAQVHQNLQAYLKDEVGIESKWLEQVDGDSLTETA